MKKYPLRHALLAALMMTGIALPGHAALKEGDSAPAFKAEASLAGNAWKMQAIDLLRLR